MRLFYLSALIGALLVGIACGESDSSDDASPNVNDAGDEATANDANAPDAPVDAVADAPVDAVADAPVDAVAACEAELEASDASRACYTGPANTLGHGLCAEGQKVCSSAGVLGCEGEVLPGAETCNEIDDDCDGEVDEDFDFATSSEHCGGCNVPCSGGCTCSGGVRIETDCSDGIDNDGDGDEDCADLGCAGQSCGAGCVCMGNAARETDCADKEDNDGDGDKDCADRNDCDNKSCGTGCVCVVGTRKETLCNDGADNDGDGMIDCMDIADCPQHSTCRRSDGFPGKCQANRSCQ